MLANTIHELRPAKARLTTIPTEVLGFCTERLTMTPAQSGDSSSSVGIPGTRPFARQWSVRMLSITPLAAIVCPNDHLKEATGIGDAPKISAKARAYPASETLVPLA